MADLNEMNLVPDPRNYDELDRALAARPALKAPRHTRSRVMAGIAALPQTGAATATTMLAAKYPVPAIKYVPPAPLPT